MVEIMSLKILTSLEETFGGIPYYIKENLKYFTFNTTNNNEFKCVPCDKIVKKVCMNNNATAQNFKAHVFSKSHKGTSSPSVDLVEALTQTFQGKIPQLVLNNVSVLGINGEDYECSMCNKILQVKRGPSATEACFAYHLLSISHKNQWEEYKAMERELTVIFGEIPDEVINNREFIRLTRSGKNYVCTVCNVLLIVDALNFEVTVDEFRDHFNSSEHNKKITLSKVFSLIPQMQINNSRVPSYLMRNIDYITISDSDLFCNLCNETIKCDQMSISVTEQNLKLHILSLDHEKNVLSRIGHHNKVFGNMNYIFGEFTDIILGNLRYLRQKDGGFSCSICEKELKKGKHFEKVKDNIIHHIKSYFHRNSFCKEMQRRECLINTLEDLFGGFPLLIKENISYLEFKGGSNFQCTLCKATLQTKKNSNDADHTARITQENFERHLAMSQHSEALASTDRMSVLVQVQLKELFDSIPQFIIQNLDNIQYDCDNVNFFCVLCNQDIFIDNGNKVEEITLQNFKNHLFSMGHKHNLKIRAKRKIIVIEKLKTIFGRIPDYILSNIEHLYENKDSFFCIACNVTIRRGSYSNTSEQNFSQHLVGIRHKSNIESIEASIDSAFQFLDVNFCVPEFLLKEIDFLENCSDGLYCNLCQEVLIVEYDDLKKTRQSLKCHIDSERHKFNLKHL